MTVGINPVQRGGEGDLGAIFKAIDIATSLYGAKLNREQAELLDKQKKDADAAKITKEDAEKADAKLRDDEKFSADMATKFGVAKPNAKDGIAIPRLAQSMGLPETTLFQPKKDPSLMPKKDPNLKSSSEALYRYDILQKNAENLRDTIEKFGTFELFGSESTDMDSKIYEMAIDYAKLVDPESIAREGEVAAAKKYMLPIRNFGGLTTSNDTAKKSIENYMRGLNTRLESRIKSLEATGQDSSSLKEVLAENLKRNPLQKEDSGLTEKAIADPKGKQKSLYEMTDKELQDYEKSLIDAVTKGSR